jgi:hypothetical protein
MTVAAELLQRHIQTLVADNTQWQTLLADDGRLRVARGTPTARPVGEGLGRPEGHRPPALPQGELLAAATPDVVDLGLPLVSGVTVVGPLLPAHVHLLDEEPPLCQLQSHLRGEVSIVSPAVGHELLVLGQEPGLVIHL